MPLVFWIFVATVTALIAAALWEAWLKRGRYLQPSKYFADQNSGQPDFGTEAIDMEHVRAALRTNNMASTLPGRYSASGRFQFMPTAPIHIKDDETYAHRWFLAFGNNPKKDASK